MTKNFIKNSWVGRLPSKNILSNDKLSESLDTSDEWIYSRTGIKQRHIALKKELTSISD